MARLQEPGDRLRDRARRSGRSPDANWGGHRSASATVTTRYDAAAAEAFGTSTDWEPIEVECIDKRLRVSLGGHLVTEAEVPDESGGRIALGVSKGVLEVRNLRVRRLEPGTTPRHR